MNEIAIFLLQIGVTVLISLAVVLHFRAHLLRVLVDLCATRDRAQFWMVFTSILLMGVPLIFGMGFHPETTGPVQAFFSVTHQLRSNMLGFLLALIGVGFVISFFALVAPRPATK